MEKIYHSRNKAQEIEGAVVPLADTYKRFHPFLGVVVAGVFTKGSINQLRSKGFSLVYFPYGNVLSAFSAVGIDASFDEDTPEKELRKKIRHFKTLVPSELRKIRTRLLELEKE